MNQGTALTLGFGIILVGALLLTSGIQNRSPSEVLAGETASAASPPAATPSAPLQPKEILVTPTSVPRSGSSGSFVAAPTANYAKVSKGLVQNLEKLAAHLGIKLTGISGYRTPAHSVAVGGFANDPHTRGEASDTEGAQNIPKAELNAFGLERPFPGSKEADHIQLLHSVNRDGGY